MLILERLRHFVGKKDIYTGIPDFLPLFPEKHYYQHTKINTKQKISESEYKKLQTKQRRHTEIELSKIKVEESQMKSPKLEPNSSQMVPETSEKNIFGGSKAKIVNSLNLDDISKSQFF